MKTLAIIFQGPTTETAQPLMYTADRADGGAGWIPDVELKKRREEEADVSVEGDA